MINEINNTRAEHILTIEDKLFALANGNKTWTNEDFRQAFLEIYDGLLKVK
jgi:Tfp pilus assembly pilus retraction ATPase PilT